MNRIYPIALIALVCACSSESDPDTCFLLPSDAAEIHPDVYFIGTAFDPGGDEVEGYVFIDRDESYHHNGEHCGGPASCNVPDPGSVPDPTPADCWGPIFDGGVAWTADEPWFVNADNASGLGDLFVLAVLENAMERWEEIADPDPAFALNILGGGTLTSETLEADLKSPDGVNEVFFGPLNNNAVAVTIMWAKVKGSDKNRRLLEWDQIYNNDTNRVQWTEDALQNPGEMDFDNVATHELGHSIGLTDQYDGLCSDQTMYGYTKDGETKKRTLEAGDINGAVALYSTP